MRPITVRITTTADPCWDELVERTPSTDVTQLTAWARVRRQVGFVPLYLFAESGDRLLGGGQILVRTLPVIGRIGYLVVRPAGRAGRPRSGRGAHRARRRARTTSDGGC